MCRRTTLAWLAGNIASGIAVYGDVRDFVWALHERNAMNAAFAGVGLVSGGGDVASAAAKLGAALPLLAPAMKRPARELLLDALGAEDFIKTFDPALVRVLEDAGGSTSVIARLLAHNDPDHLRRLINSPLRIDPPDYARFGGPPGFLGSGKAGEDLVRRYYNDGMPNVGPASYIADGSRRFPDIVTGGDSDLFRMHESKVGFVRAIFSQRQVSKDAALRWGDPRQAESVTWHFFASNWTGRIGPSPRVLELLESNNIPFILHIPS